jgi:hypothetical protein
MREGGLTEHQENPTKEVAIHSPSACRNERASCQETMEANPEKMEPIDREIAILEKMEAMDLKANPGEIESESEHREFPKEDATVKPVRGQTKRRSDLHLAARRSGEPNVLTRGDCGFPRRLVAACSLMKQYHGAREISSGKFGPREIMDRGRN